MPTLTINKKARHDYEILETLEAGLKLLGHEVKSVRNGNINLKGSYISVRQGDAYLKNAHIGKYQKAGELPGYDAYRERKLLLKKREIDYLYGKQQEAGLTIIPLVVYTKNNRVKLEIGIGRGKKKYDKRQDKKKKDLDREMRRKYGV